MAEGGGGPGGGESLLFLTDEQLRKGIEAMFFAYRAFTADPDRILEDMTPCQQANHVDAPRARALVEATFSRRPPERNAAPS